MSRMYSCSFQRVSTGTAAQDFFEFSPAANKAIELVGLHISQNGVADVGDAQEEMLEVQVIRGYTASGSGGSSVTPAVVKPADTAAGFTCECNNTTLASTGTGVIMDARNFNVRAGLEYIWAPGMEIGANASHTTLVVRLPVSPADAVSLSGTAYVREIG